MNAKEMDDCLHALGQTYAFYGKELDSLQVGFWRQFFNGKNPHHALTAIKNYAISGRYAPKPKDLLEEYQKLKDADTVERSYVTPALAAPKCPADVSLGWRYLLPRFYGNDVGGLMGKVDKPVREMLEKNRRMLVYLVASNFLLYFGFRVWQTLFNNFAVLQYNNLVCIFDG